MHGYVVALGSNRRHGRHGSPAGVLRAAVEALQERGVAVSVVAPMLHSAPVGPSLRRYANTVAVIASPLGPAAMLQALKAIERDFGRRAGQRWGARVLDLDLVLWSGGRWRSRTLQIPHRHYRERGFVLAPLQAAAPRWRDPVTGLSPRHLHARLTRPRAVPKPRHP